MKKTTYITGIKISKRYEPHSCTGNQPMGKRNVGLERNPFHHTERSEILHKSFIDNAQAKDSIFRLLTEYEGYDYIAHYDNEGIITSIVEIVPEKTPCPTYHYTKSRRVEFANSGHSLVYKDKR